MAGAVMVPSLPLDEDVRWRHTLVYQAPSPEESYLAGQFGERLRHVLQRTRTHKGAPSRTEAERLQAAYDQGVAAGRKEVCACNRCGAYSDEQLRSLHGRVVTVGPLTLLTEGRVEPLDAERPLTPSQRRLLVPMLEAYPSHAAWGSLVPVGRSTDDRHTLRIQMQRLRPRLLPYGVVVELVRGLGYRLVVQEVRS